MGNDGIRRNSSGIIIGAYTNFPTIIPNAEELDPTNNDYWFSEIFVNPSLLFHGKIEKIDFFLIFILFMQPFL
jgi:hypothetical protein